MNQQSSKAYTLIEMLVVLAIIALAFSIIPPFLPNAVASASFKTATRELASSLKQTQNRAINSQQEKVLILDVEQNHYMLEGRLIKLKIPDTAKLSLVTARSEQLSDVKGRIRFFPDGSSTGGQIKMSYKTREYIIDVHWLTGKVRILP